MNLRRARRADPEINLTSLIDVVLLLLIFFMVSTTFEREAEISIDLPEAGARAAPAEEPMLEVLIDAQGQYYVDGRAVAGGQSTTLQRALREAAQDAEAPRVLISADRETPHQAVVTAMDAARQVGFLRLTFATTERDE